MDADPLPEHLRMIDAVARWCDPELVEGVREAERQYSETQLSQFRRAPTLTKPSERGKPIRQDRFERPAFMALDTAWDFLERCLCSEIEHGGLFLEGVEYTSRQDRESQSIRGAFAAEMRFDFWKNTLEIGFKRYLAIIVSQSPSPWAAIESPPRAPPKGAGPLNVRALGDDDILALLEEHAKRVIEGPDAKLIAPGKISLMPIVQGKMRHRAEMKEMLPSIEHEAAVLETWIALKVTLHQTPKASTIAKSLSKEYNLLKARSKAGIQRSDG